MAKKNASSRSDGSGNSREDRLKASLKANLARRKAQAKKRSTQDAQDGAVANAPQTGQAPKA